MNKKHITGFLTKRDWAIAILIILACVAIIAVKDESKSKNIKKVSEKIEETPVKKKNISTSQKKERFKEMILDPAQTVFTKLEKQYEKAKKEISKNPNSKYLDSLREEYKVKNNPDLLKALKPHPISLTLAQAAMESAWGTSRFFNQANNIFGIWSFNKNEPRIAAGKKRGDKTIWVRKYNSIEDSITHYYKILAVGNAYKEFREEKMLTSNSMRLAIKLDKYSEKGAEYGKELNAIIKYNNFQNFD